MANLPKSAKPLVDGDKLIEIKHGNGAPLLLRLRDRENEKFIFAQFMDNEAYHSMALEDWRHLASGAIERFMATRGLTSTGTKTSATGPYDFSSSWT